MAIQKSTFITGRLQNIIFYQRDGKFFARTMPDKVKQSAATKIRSRNFGIASTSGKTLRKLLAPVLPFPKDKNMQSRFSGAIAKWLRLYDVNHIPLATRLPFLTNFNFNEKTSIKERWKVPIVVTQPANDRVEVYIPGFLPTTNINAPAYTTAIICTITTAVCRLNNGVALGSFTEILNIAYNNEPVNARVLTLPVPIASGSLVITAVSLTYIISGRKINDKITFVPSSVIDARYC